MNISSVVIATWPERAQRLAALLDTLPGVEVQARAADGRIAATLEDHALASAADTYVRLHTLPDVQSVSLIYQYSDDTESEALS